MLFYSMTNEQRASLDPGSDEYYRRVHGSQTQLFGWLVYTVLLWCLKLCWLFFFKRLGDGVDNMTLKINIGFAIVGVTFFGTFFTILCSCWPIYKKWQIYPDPGSECIWSLESSMRLAADDAHHFRHLLSCSIASPGLDPDLDQLDH